MVQRGLYLAAVLVASLSLGGASYGADSDMMKALMERVNALEAKNSELERRANAQESTSKALDAAIAKEETTASNVTSSQAIKIGGYVDTSLQYNFNQPQNQNNNLRVFDVDPHGFNLHLAELTFDGLPSKPGEAGFRLDVAWGNDTRWIKSTDKFSSNGERLTDFVDNDFKQAYIEYIVPVGCGCSGEKKGIKLDFGKFVTWAGYETIEAADNFNSSRSILFGYAIPFTHTGVRATYDVFTKDCNRWTIGGAVYNGWDNTQDQNRDKTFALYSDWAPTKWFEMIGTAMLGHEQAEDQRDVFATAIDPFNGGDPTDPATAGFQGVHTGDTQLGVLDGGRTTWNFRPIDGGASRFLGDLNLIFKPFSNDNLIIALNGDYANEQGGRWYGGAAYVKYTFCKKWYIAARAETFNDHDGVRTGIKQTLSEGTVTVDYALTDALHSRLEFRHDHSNRGVFAGKSSTFDPIAGPNLDRPFDKKDQNTVMYSWLYKF